MNAPVTLGPAATLALAADVADRLRTYSAAVSADSWALDAALRLYRFAPNDAARIATLAIITDLVRVVSAEVLSPLELED